MRFTKFTIKNFKGIKHAELRLDQFGQGKIFTLVGLNECGKTTILEAINCFSPDVATESLFKNDIFRKIEHKDLVPKDRKDNFTGKVEVVAELEFSSKDLTDIKKFLNDNFKLQLDTKKLGPKLEIQKIFKFEQSDYKQETNLWDILLHVKTSKERRFKLIDSKNDVWQKTVSYIRSLIPNICYFPTFLFEFPSRVYLSDMPDQYKLRNKYYYQVVQDVLDSLDRGLTIEESIVARVKKVEEGKKWDFISFWHSDRKSQVDAVMRRLEDKITKDIFTKWNEIFGSTFTKTIKVDWGVDTSQPNSPVYLSFSIQDGASIYSLAERSLGFRWFFCFLLFTQFRKSRRGSGTLFLLDEPASNLHSTAQHQLLESFETITEGNNSLIYSTHSHYMINPKWLEGAFIIQNGAIEYEDEISGAKEFYSHETDIKVFPYRRFVGENPDKATYYQPILDALDYSPSVLEHQSKTIMVEGKNDYYVFTYFKEIIFGDNTDFKILPSSGANDLGPLISLYLGWGYSFRVLLDDDSAGRKAKKRYIDEWFLSDSIVMTIGDVIPCLVGKKLEGLISSEGGDLIKSELGLNQLTKKQTVRFFQDKIARKEKIDFDAKTLENFKKILKALGEDFNDNV